MEISKMADDGYDNVIRITHYINPHMFWFKYEDTFFKTKELRELEDKLHDILEDPQRGGITTKKYEPKKKEMIAVFHFSCMRWWRAQVDDIIEFQHKSPKYIMWAVDYGVPVQSESRWIRKLPEELALVNMRAVHFGGLNTVVAAENTYDFLASRPTMKLSDKWSPAAINMICELIDTADKIVFESEVTKDGQMFGNLKITINQIKEVQAKDLLLETGHAVNSNEFFQVLKRVETNKIPRWQTNNGNTHVFKEFSNEFNRNRVEYVPTRRYSENDETEKSNYDIEIEKKVNDWQIKNGNIDIDDIAFSDSVSMSGANPNPNDAATEADESEKSEKSDNTDELIGKSCKDKKKVRYKNFTPRPPIYEVSSSSAMSANASHEKIEFSSEKTNKHNDNDSKTSGSDNKPTEEKPRSVPSRLQKLSNKRKSLEAKLKASANCTIIPAGYSLKNLQPVREMQVPQKKNIPSSSKDSAPALMTKATEVSQNRQTKSRPLNEIDEVCAPSNLSSHLVLVHGRAAKPIDQIEKSNFSQEVHTELENMRLNNVYRIQSFTWPHLMRGNSAMVINSPRTGKTMSYLPAICSLVQMLSDDKQVVDGPGPVAIIVATSSIAVEKVSRMCRRFYQSFSQFSVVESYGMRNKADIIKKLLNGCEILISTPSALVRLLEEKVELFRAKRIRYLVIDNIDLIHEELRNDLHTIIKNFCVIDKNTGKTSVQIAVTARTWHPLIMGFLKISNNPQLCIGAYIEGAVYGRSEFKMKLVGKKSKIHEIFDFLEEHPFSSERTIIICNTDEDVDEVAEAMKANSFFCLSVCSSSTALEIANALECQSKCTGDMSILVCTDSVLPEMKIKNIQNSIHYSLPKSWSKFSYRFSSHFGYYEDFVKKEKAEKPPAVSLILLDENNNSQLPKLISFFEKHKCSKIPMEIINLSNQIKVQLEEERRENNKLLCNQLLEFGECWERSDCSYRHSFTKFDTPGDNIPTNGDIKVKILSVLSPTHYCVRLLEHMESTTNAHWKPIKCSNGYLRFSLEFSKYFSDSNNHQSHYPYNLNDLCVIEDGSTYYRCKIVAENISKKKMSAGSASGQVKLLDYGSIIACKFTNLLVLPDQFKEFPYQAVDLRLTGIVPSDFEWDWDSKATATVRNWVENYVTKNMHVQAKVVFALMDTIWVDNIVIVEKLKTISSHVYRVNIKRSLIEKNFAIANERGLEVITEMAKDCGLLNAFNKSEHLSNSSSTVVPQPVQLSDALPSSTQINNEPKIPKSSPSPTSMGSLHSLNSVDRPMRKIRRAARMRNLDNEVSSIINEKWEFLNENSFTQIFIGAFYNPNNFYVQNIDNFQRLDDLYQAIESFIETKKLPISEPKIGLNCLVSDADGKYNRAKITNFECDGKSQKIKATVFLCDIGMSSTYPLEKIMRSSTHIVNMMPFQAIRCKLTGITSTTNGVWTEEVCDRIYDEIDACEAVYARPVKEYPPNMKSDLKYWKYEILMVDCTTEKDVKINEKIVEKGWAEYDPDTKHYLDVVIIAPSLNEPSSQEDETENWDHINYKREPAPASEVQPFDFSKLNLNELEINFTEEEILNMLNLPPTAKILPPLEEEKPVKASKVKLQNEPFKNSADGSVVSCKSSVLSKSHRKNQIKIAAALTGSKNSNTENYRDPQMPMLEAIHRCPQVKWKQSDSLICLQIYAPDIKDYYLNVTTTSLIFSTRIQDELNMVVLNFLGGLDPEKTSHEIRGLYVIIRLIKGLKGFTWPRLTWESDKLTWLKYDYEAIVVDKEVIKNSGQYRQGSYYIDESSSETSDNDGLSNDESEDVNADKMFDPLADDFD